MKVEQMNQQLQGFNQQIKDSEQNVEQAKKALSNAQDTLTNAERELRDKRRGQAFVASIGAAITLAPALAIPIVVPVLGWVAGPTMVVVSLTVIEDNIKSAQSGVSSAKDNVNDAENWLQAKKERKIIFANN